MTAHSVDDLLAAARARLERANPIELAGIVAAGGLVVDIRPQAQRSEEGTMPGAVIIERNVLEWRFDLLGEHHLAEVRDYDQPVVVFCSEGYASSFAAVSLQELGFMRATDLDGGYLAWEAWSAGRTTPAPAAAPN